MNGILAQKIGMASIFDERGDSVPVTVMTAGPCYVTQIKKEETDGYSAVQIGFLPKKKKHTVKPLEKHFEKANVEPLRFLREFKCKDMESLKLGDEIKADMFSVGERVNVFGLSKGKGFAGVMKRHGFSGGPKSHGQSDRLRAPGSIGQSASPSRVMKGVKMPGRMGGKRVIVKNLEIVKIDVEKNLIYIKGAVPGPNKGVLEVVKKVLI